MSLTLSPLRRAFPSLIRARVSFAVAALHTETSQLPSDAYFDPSRSGHPSTASTPEYLTQEQREAIDIALRVDQAGEIAANYIYKGQHAVLGRDPKLGPLVQVRSRTLRHCPGTVGIDVASLMLNAFVVHISFHLRFHHRHFGCRTQEMWDQEKKHLAVMNKLQVQHQVRPTLLWEFAKAGGYGLGVVTALMGKEAAMACTEAVETVIGEHYDEYVSVGFHSGKATHALLALVN